ncbi:hypothetical protein GCM10010442_43490 [Kitasatospora kifunensis]
MPTATTRDVVLTCTTDGCGTAEAMPHQLVDPDDDATTYKAACEWRQSKWRDGWRWLGSLRLMSCPACPPLVIVGKSGEHLAGPGLRAGVGHAA